MRRRAFIAGLGAAAAWPLTVRAQQTGRTPRIGVLISGKDGPDVQAWLAGLRQGLEQLGWSDGRNVQVDYRFGEGNPARVQPLAKEPVAMLPEVIVAQTPPVVTVVRREAGAIPIVFVDVSDPIGPGFVASLARPGGNLTGMLNFEASVVGKWLAMLKQIAPNLARVAMLGNPKTTAFSYFQQAAATVAPSQDRHGVRIEHSSQPDHHAFGPTQAARDLLLPLRRHQWRTDLLRGPISSCAPPMMLG